MYKQYLAQMEKKIHDEKMERFKEHAKKVKETSMTPTNKHSRTIGHNWHDGEYATGEDTRSMKHQI